MKEQNSAFSEFCNVGARPVYALSFSNSAGSILEEEEEEEEDVVVFNDTVEGPWAPAVKPGRVTQA